MKIMNYILCMLMVFASWCCSDDESNGNSKENETTVSTDGGYLFAHMMGQDYARLFYSVSRDGIHWETLNRKRIVLEDYCGHPDICRGGDGAFYMIGVRPNTGIPILWRSLDLATWTETELDKQIFNKISEQGYKNEETYYGAPKMFYDKDSQQYIITWHAGKTGNDGDEEEWKTKRTFYILTSDFKTFTNPKRLFSFTGSDENMATIDVIIRKIDGKYCAIIKDERWPADYPEVAKTIRLSKSESLTGPYTNPGAAITPAGVWHEAPILIPTPDEKGWYLFAERYPKQYDLYQAPSIDGPWKELYFPGPDARHGCIVKVDEATYQGILKAYKK